MENNKFTLGDMKQVIENMDEEKSVRLHGYHDSDITLEVFKQDNRPEALMNLVSVRFEMNGRVIASANYIRVNELEKALNEIKDGKTNYFFSENPATLDERIAREKKFQFYVQELGRLEDKHPMFDVERCTVCYGNGTYAVKPDITDKFLIERYHELSWENSINDMMKLDDAFIDFFGEKSAKNIALLAKANNIVLRVSRWNAEDEKRNKPQPTYWNVSGAIKLNVFERRSEDGTSATIREALVHFEPYTYINCSTSSTDKHLDWLVRELTEMVDSPQGRIKSYGNDEDVLLAADKLKEFTEELGTYTAELKKSRGSIERD